MSQSERRSTTTLISASVILFSVILVSTHAYWKASRASIDQKIQGDFLYTSGQATDQIGRKLDSLDEDIKALQALFTSSEEVSLDEWRRYLEYTEFVEGNVGMKGISLVVPDPSGKFSVYFGSDAELRTDWIDGKDIPTGTRMVVLDVPGLPVPEDFLVLAPVENEEKNPFGYVAALISYEGFFGDIANKEYLNDINIQLYNASGAGGRALFSKEKPPENPNALFSYLSPVENTLELQGKKWIIRFSEGSGFRENYGLTIIVPWMVVAIGTMILIFSMTIIITLFMSRRRAVKLVAIAQAKLKESLELYKNIFDNTYDGIAILNTPDGKNFFLRDCNPAGLAMFGLDRGKSIGRNLSEVLAGEQAKELIARLRRAWKIGSLKRKSLFLDNGKIKGWFEYYALKLSSGDAVIMYRDITARTMHEEDLIKFQLAVENTSDHIIITNPKGEIVFANKAAAKITGYDIEEMIGQKPKMWGGLMPREYYDGMWKTIRDEKKPFVGEITNRRKNGEEYVAAVSISPVLDKKKNISFFVGIERDITREKEIDKAKTEFVSLASHQLRTPLSIISWYTEMLLDGEKGKINSDQERYLLEISKGNRRMIDLVNALLNVSRIDMGAFMVEPKPEDIREIADGVYEDFEIISSQKGVILSKDYAEDLPKISLDRNLIRIIFQNLLSNSIKYTPKGGKVSLKISKNGKEESALIEISDTGYGIPESQQDKIFSKLFRADNAQEIDPDGTGLGLYITKAIVKLANGEIWFSSKEGKGTSFYVTIPFSGMDWQEGGKRPV